MRNELIMVEPVNERWPLLLSVAAIKIIRFVQNTIEISQPFQIRVYFYALVVELETLRTIIAHDTIKPRLKLAAPLHIHCRAHIAYPGYVSNAQRLQKYGSSCFVYSLARLWESSASPNWQLGLIALRTISTTRIAARHEVSFLT